MAAVAQRQGDAPDIGIAAAKSGVPAVVHTIAILRYLQRNGNQPASMIEIARSLEINNSTCFNILKTLAGESVLAYDPDTKRYTLGTTLIELAALVDSHGRLLNAALAHAEQVAAEFHQVCLICRKTEDDAFLVVGKAEGRGAIKITASVGDRFPPNGAVLAKAHYAWCDVEEVDRMVSIHGLPARSPSSITRYAEFLRELDLARERGYSTSVGEYFEERNAVGAAVLDGDRRPVLLFVVTGFASVIHPRSMPKIGVRLRAAADAITREVFGDGD